VLMRKWRWIVNGLVPLESNPLFGAEDTPDEPVVESEAGPEDDGSLDEEETDKKSYSADYVRKLKAEAQRLRKERNEEKQKADELAAAEAEKAKAELSELERLKLENEETKSNAEKLAAEIRQTRLESVVVLEAGKLKFNDPVDAMSFLNASEIEWDDTGRPTAKSVATQLSSLAKAKPYLVAAIGSGDGGPKGASPTPTTPEEKTLKTYTEKYIKDGYVVRQ